MKCFKKISVFVLVGILCFSSVVLNYNKAYSCKAFGAALEIGGAVVLVGFLLYGSYYVANPENQEDIKQTLSGYKDKAVESAKVQYEFNKKLFNDFCDYAAQHNGGSASVYTSDGRSYSIDDMQAEGFPSFEKWDEQMKKQGEKSGGSFWDKIKFGLDLLGLIAPFFNTSAEYLPPDDYNQRYFTGDDGYINRETGDAFIYLDSDLNYYKQDADYTLTGYYCKTQYRYEHFKNYGVNTTFRAAIFLVGNGVVGDSIKSEDSSGNWVYEWYRYSANARAVYGYIGSSSVSYLSGVTGGYVQYYKQQGDVCRDDIVSNNSWFRSDYSCRFKDKSNSSSYDFTQWDYLSTNIPVFLTMEEAKNYVATGDYSSCLNLPSSLPTATPVPDDSGNDSDTPLSVYVNHFAGGTYTAGDVVNTNYNIANNWDGSVTNLTYILDGGDDDGGLTDRVVTVTPVPLLPDEDGSNTTYNYFISLENAVTNIYNFFIIDTGQISEELNNISISPVVSFDKLLQRVNKLKSAFSDEELDTTIALADSSGASVQGIYYPVIKIKCHTALRKYLSSDSLTEIDGVNYIVLVDFKDWALYFVRARAFLKAALWIGMFFYLLKQFKVVISIT